MTLSQILQVNCVKVPLENKAKELVIEELVELLADNKQLNDKEEVLESVMTRERTRSTGIGSGIAIPHGKCEGVKELVIAIGIASDGIDFDSIDGKSVTIVILLASPVGQTGPHIQALASISKLMLDKEFRSSLESAKTAQEVYDLIGAKENE